MASEAPLVDLDTEDAFYALHHFIFQRDSMKRGTSLSQPRRDIDNYLDSLENIPELQSTPKPDTRANRVSLLLDAFVKICQPHCGEVLALSLALRPSAGSTDSTLATVGKPEKLILNIASNGPPPTELTNYLGGIWNTLKQISVLEKEARTKGGHPDAPESNTGHSPPAMGSDETAQSQLIGQLHEDIHLFCFRKTRSSLVGFVGPWNTFFPFFLSISQTTCIGGSGKVHDLFSTVCCALNLIINGLLECTPVFIKAHSDLWRAYWQLVKLGKEDDWYDELEFFEEFVDEFRLQFSLSKIIYKAKKLNAHIQTILKIAFSPRLRPWLECELDVNLVNSGPRRLPFPTQNYLEACVRKMAATAEVSTVYDKYAAKSKEDIEEQKATDIEEVLKDLPAVLSKISKSEDKLKRTTRDNERLPDDGGSMNVRLQQMKPHAECTLLAYLDQSSETGVQQFSYIAVTKLSCFSCWLLFEAYRRHTNRCFIVRGCHSDTSHPWVIPDFKEASLEAACRKHILEDRIFKLFALHLTPENRSRKRGHSTDGSPDNFDSCEMNSTPFVKWMRN